MPRLHRERAPEQAQEFDGVRILPEAAAADGLRALRVAGSEGLERGGDVRVPPYFRYLSNHARTRSR